MKKFGFLLIVLIAVTGCDTIPNKNTAEILDRIVANDTLVIEAYFSECGEWGGHHEFYEVFINNGKEYKYNSTRDTVNCPDPSKFNRRIIEESRFILLSKEDIIIFLNEMNKTKIEDLLYNHADESYKVYIKNDSLKSQYHYNVTSDWEVFVKFKETLR